MRKRGKKSTEAVAVDAAPVVAKGTSIEVPSVWHEGGYLILVHEVDEEDETVRYLSTQSCLAHSTSFKNFPLRVTRPAPEINAWHLVINLLVRHRTGLFPLRVRDERKLVMLLDKQELLKLSERELARSWATIMGVKGPERIKGAAREKAVDEMIAKASADAAKSVDENGVPKPPKEKKPKKEKKVKEPKPPKAPKAPKVPKEKRAPRERKKAAPGENPYRKGSMKATAFEFFVKEKAKIVEPGKLREKCLAQIQELGAAEATSKSWYALFLKAVA